MAVRSGIGAALVLFSFPLLAQTPCANTQAYSPCEIVFELNDAEAAAHPNPYTSVELGIEFRSPDFRTFLMPAFFDGGRRMVVRFTPIDAGEWVYRVSSNIARFEGTQGKFTAAPSDSPGWLQPANVHHWAFVEGNSKKPHLWMGDTCLRFGFLEQPLFEKIIDTRAAQKFNHMRGLVIGGPEDAAKAFPGPDQPDPAYFQHLDERIRYMNAKGIIADLVLGGTQNQLVKLFPAWQQRERYVRYLVARYAAMNVTWQGVQEFENYENGRDLMKEIGGLLKKLDPYQHPRSTHTVATSSSLLDDGWMNFVSYRSSDDNLGAIEHQLYPVPFVNLEFGYEDSGAGKSGRSDVDANTLRRRLWNAAMDGQSPTFGNTGTAGAGNIPVDGKYLDSPGAKQMGIWYDFFSKTRYWDLEPYFDVDGGRALALEGIEYIIYVEKPGPIEVLVEKHGYDVAWFDPATGETKKMKDWKGERFTAEPPDSTHDWVLHISREGRKESMLRSYKFESRPIQMQEVERSPQKIPYDVEQPAQGALAPGASVPYAAVIKRETHATRSMMWLWTGEVASGGQGARVLGAGQKGTMTVPAGLAKQSPAVIDVRLYGMNAVGKVYSLDKTYQYTK